MSLPSAVALASNVTALELKTAGEFAAAVVALYLILVATGRLLKRRFGARLGVVYQLFCVTFAGYLGGIVIAPWFFGLRELGAASTILGAGVFVRLLDQYLWRWHFERKRQAPTPKFVREAAGGLILIVAVLLVLELGYHVQVPGLLAGSGIVAVILGLAMQDALSNVIAGLTLQLSRPFAAGDWLLIDNQHVKVVEVNWRSSRFVTNDDVQLDIPNQQIVKQTVINYHGGGVRHAMRLEIGVEYDAPPNRVREILTRAAAQADGVISQPPPNVFLKTFGDSAIIYEVRYWMEDHRLNSITADSVRTNAWYSLRRNDIKIPFPTRTVQLERRPPSSHRIENGESTATINFLRAQPLFQGVTDDHLRFLATRSPIRQFGEGEPIIREGEEGSSMFVMIQGQAGVSITKQNQSTRVATLGSGDCFGEMSLLTGESRSASVVAVQDCDVLEVTKTTFAKVIEADPEVLPRLSDLLAKRQMETEGVLETHSQKTGGNAGTEAQYRAGFLNKLRSFFQL